MDAVRLRQLLEQIRSGELDVDRALSALRHLPYSELGYARVDHHRALRLGLPEVVLGESKTEEQIVGISRRLLESGQHVLVTRVDPEKARGVLAELPDLSYSPMARVLSFENGPVTEQSVDPVAIVTAGTSDLGVAEEASETLRLAGIRSRKLIDVGVAGLHRLLPELGELAQAPVVIVVAGMEGALPSVIGGLLGAPIIAVPTSVGYGASLGGLAALLGMLTGCASGVTVVNIDNGFGAAAAAARIVLSRRRDVASEEAAAP
ncbi:MAG TPA: nickel pincer cofactor biosynthesis protein LarB [Polyangiaceae bacterium]